MDGGRIQLRLHVTERLIQLWRELQRAHRSGASWNGNPFPPPRKRRSSASWNGNVPLSRKRRFGDDEEEAWVQHRKTVEGDELAEIVDSQKQIQSCATPPGALSPKLARATSTRAMMRTREL